ncbi:MAG: hypothetical protein QOE37_612 [Microbacteriaceae bacterium]|jgi:beta-glucanase (GH16 family)|nr:hypothetical protein [Microbacteriaceae bacterium]
MQPQPRNPSSTSSSTDQGVPVPRQAVPAEVRPRALEGVRLVSDQASEAGEPRARAAGRHGLPPSASLLGTDTGGFAVPPTTRPTPIQRTGARVPAPARPAEHRARHRVEGRGASGPVRRAGRGRTRRSRRPAFVWSGGLVAAGIAAVVASTVAFGGPLRPVDDVRGESVVHTGGTSALDGASTTSTPRAEAAAAQGGTTRAVHTSAASTPRHATSRLVKVAGTTIKTATAATPATSVQRVAAATSSAGRLLPSGKAWNLVWSDEFAGSGLSSSRWSAMDKSTFGDGNQQLECELASNAAVRGGALAITARRESPAVQCGGSDSRFPNGRSYSGATIETKGKASFTYGYFEIRAKLPVQPGASKGLWPAFWLRPVDGGAGEIDVLEAIGTSSAGSPDTIHQTIHPAYGGSTPMQPHAVDYPRGSLSSGYHVYGLDWEPDSITWYIDGKPTWTRNTSTTSWLKQDFSRPFFMRINLAVGGGWPGSPDGNTAFPSTYDVDWVHVYKH